VTIASYFVTKLNDDLRHLGRQPIEDDDVAQMASVLISDWLCPEQLRWNPVKEGVDVSELASFVDPNSHEALCLLYGDLTTDHITGERITYQERLVDLEERKLKDPLGPWGYVWRAGGKERISLSLCLMNAAEEGKISFEHAGLHSVTKQDTLDELTSQLQKPALIELLKFTDHAVS